MRKEQRSLGREPRVGPRGYRGFVSSYEEVRTNKFTRLTDEQWAAKL